ncbi:glycosyl hydrolase family 76 protein [Massarina eburnea CBS 473.64]|uniref:Mannan endo-1,6-alpha-mannosidase n=1 Tax=Massarina eburnea CBS 473.64 TaxID=1395130 RepID=A0A6A6RHP4_9PLEO|nr:glycosyl hydrolase family 76 protein [Massarina eburnea CBS 473.64]
MSIFNNRYKFPAHMVTLLLIIAAMVITGVRLVVKTGPSSRSDTMALAMPDQVRSAAKNVAQVLVSMYADTQTGTILSGIPGLLKYPPYYWWEAGAMFGQLIDYWYYTGDTQWNDLIREGIVHQIGEGRNFMPANQSKDEGNDDQLFWAFTVMSAAEYNFPNPPDNVPGWLALAQSIFNQLVDRWEPATCGGGVRWQIYQWLPGWNYKNLASNGGFFQLGARLALYTGNDTYAQKAVEIYDWLANTVPLITPDYKVYDGTDVLKNCTDYDRNQWTYNYGILIGGCAYMYNYTNGSQLWADRLNGFINQSNYFFPPGYESIMLDPCEISQACNIDQVSFKGYLARWFAVAAQLAPFTAPQILPHLQRSGKAAAQTCVSSDGVAQPFKCGNRWYWQGYDGNGGVGQQLAALSVISANLITVAAPPKNVHSGGESQGDPGLGTGGYDELPVKEPPGATKGGRAGASFLTILVVGGVMSGGWWLIH